MRYFITLLLLVVMSTTAQAHEPSRAAMLAETLTLTDGVTTYHAIYHDKGEEADPIMPSSRGGIAGVTVAKILGINAIDQYASEKHKDFILPIIAGFFGDATVNNFMVIQGHSNSTSAIVGGVAGVGFYYLGKHFANENNDVYITPNAIGYQHKF